MNQKEISFLLPIGYEDDKGKFHREGKMRSTTAMDEIEIHADERLSFQKHYHDILLFNRVIIKLGDIASITCEIIENLYEADFRYLQTLYQSLNSDMKSELVTKCPKCSEINRINLSDVYKNIDFYANKKDL
jgi:hypothetical protein